MKKILILFVSVLFMSCSQDQVEIVSPKGEASLSKMDGKLLSFKDDNSFIKEYSALSEMKTSKEIQNWISKKGLSSLLNSSYLSAEVQDSLIDNNRIIYSDALRAILNNESKFKINDKVIWVNQRNLYLLDRETSNLKNQELLSLKNELKIYGNIINKLSFSKDNAKNELISRFIVPNENLSKDWLVYYNSAGRDRRIILTLFNETIVLNNVTSSSKMFVRCLKQGRYCSVWSCSWKQEFEQIRVGLNIYAINSNCWQQNLQGSQDIGITSSNTTILLATSYLLLNGSNPNFSIDASAVVTTYNGSALLPYSWSQTVSWF